MNRSSPLIRKFKKQVVGAAFFKHQAKYLPKERNFLNKYFNLFSFKKYFNAIHIKNKNS